MPFPSPGDLPNPGITPEFPVLQADSLMSELPITYLFPIIYYEGALMSQQEFPGLDKLSPACSGTSTPRGNVLASHSPMSPENIKMTHRHRYGLRAEEGPLHRGKSRCQRSEQGRPEHCLCALTCPLTPTHRKHTAPATESALCIWSSRVTEACPWGIGVSPEG